MAQVSKSSAVELLLKVEVSEPGGGPRPELGQLQHGPPCGGHQARRLDVTGGEMEEYPRENNRAARYLLQGVQTAGLRIIWLLQHLPDHLCGQ